MIIKKSKWHYKFIMFATGESPKTLCAYVQTLALTLLFIIPALIVTVIGKQFIKFINLFLKTENKIEGEGTPIYSIGLMPYTVLTFFLITVFCGIFMFYTENVYVDTLGLIFWTLVIFCSAIFGITKLSKLKKSQRRKKGLIGSYLKAKKDKICPIIKYED